MIQNGEAVSQLILASSGSVWTQLLTALVVGLLVAFALQMLLTSLGVAIGMSVLAIRASAAASEQSDLDDQAIETQIAEDVAEDPEASQPESSGAQLGFWAGFGVLLTVNAVLFVACFLASRFSQAGSPLTGAIEGIVIWSAYLLILIWLSSTALSSVVGSLLGIATGGFQQMVRPIGALLTSKESATEAEPLAAIRQEMRQEMRQEIQAVFDPNQIQSQIQSMIQSEIQRSIPTAVLQTSAQSSRTNAILAILQQQITDFLLNSDKLTPKRVDRNLRPILEVAQAALPDSEKLPQLDRPRVLHLLMQRQELSDKQRHRVLHQVEVTWNEFRQFSLDKNEDAIASFDANSDSASSSQQFTQTVLQKLAEQLPGELSDSLPDSLLENGTVERIAQQLPVLLQQAGHQLPAGVSLTMLAMAVLRGKDLLPENGIDTHQIRETLDRLMQQSGMTHLNQTVAEQVDFLRDRSVQQVEQMQQTVQKQVDKLKIKTSQQLQATQKAATIAAWWLFLTVSTGAISAALAGAIGNWVFVSHI